MEAKTVSVDMSFLLKQIEILGKKNAELTKQMNEKNQYVELLEKEIEIYKTNFQIKETKTKKPAERKSGEYSPVTCKGIPKPQKADPIKSYTDFISMCDYFKQNRKYKYYAMWVIGCATGLRYSDISLIKFKTFLNEDGTFKERFKIYEKKTSKLQDCLITPAIKKALTEYLDSIHWKFDMNDYLVGINTRSAWRVLNKACNAVGLQINMGTHTMRKSFVTIAYCLGGFTQVDNRLEVIQGILNHSSQQITRRYIGVEQDLYDKARMVVSDFLLGETGIDELSVQESASIDDVMEKLDKIEELLSNAV